MVKIYCKNCKYWGRVDVYNGDHCHYNKWKMDKITGVYYGDDNFEKHKHYNANNDCEHFKKNFWYKTKILWNNIIKYLRR